jgi:hypothetical protein
MREIAMRREAFVALPPDRVMWSILATAGVIVALCTAFVRAARGALMA